MADDFTVRGAENFLALSKALKAAGRTQLRKDLNTELRRAVRPLVPLTRASARRLLPQSGGLAESVARAPQRVQVRTGASTAGVRIVVGKSRSGARLANRGEIKHPVFGDRERWVTQQVNDGWFDDTLNREAPRVAKPAVERALDNMIDRVIREAR